MILLSISMNRVLIYRKIIVIRILLKVNIIKQYKDKLKFQLKNIIIDINEGKILTVITVVNFIICIFLLFPIFLIPVYFIHYFSLYYNSQPKLDQTFINLHKFGAFISHVFEK
jgi:hypothetical protein